MPAFFIFVRMNYSTIEFKQKYKDINVTLYWLVEQAKEGIEYCDLNFPKFNNPVEMYYYLKARTRFENDPTGTELIQSPGTLFENNMHGQSGLGDCDCFSTLLLSCLWANGWFENYIMLYGNKKICPSHIAIETVVNGETVFLDLTQSKPNSERFYKYYQKIPVFS